MSEALDLSASMGNEAVRMSRAGAAQEIPRMNLEAAHRGRRSGRLTQEHTAQLPGVCERAFAGAPKAKSLAATACGPRIAMHWARRSPRPHPAFVPRPVRPFRTLEHAG